MAEDSRSRKQEKNNLLLMLITAGSTSACPRRRSNPPVSPCSPGWLPAPPASSWSRTPSCTPVATNLPPPELPACGRWKPGGERHAGVCPAGGCQRATTAPESLAAARADGQPRLLWARLASEIDRPRPCLELPLHLARLPGSRTVGRSLGQRGPGRHAPPAPQRAASPAQPCRTRSTAAGISQDGAQRPLAAATGCML